MKERVLLTGASGFVGRQILKHLLNQDFEVDLVIRNESNIELEDIAKCASVVFTNDLFAENEGWWVKTFENIDTVIHAAWFTKPGEYLESPKNYECMQGTLKMARGSIDAGVRRFIGIGTCFEYDLNYELLTFDTPLKPATPYARAKVSTFKGLTELFSAGGVEFAWCRLFYLYGEGENSKRLVPYIRSMLEMDAEVELSDGNQIRDYLDVQEAGRLIVGVARSASQGPINICSGIPITVRELAEGIAVKSGKQELLRFGARPNLKSDPPRIVGVMNWEFK
jgi:dTDP-6-deoxy-L-talose 4-dehydrogenase (NAD+)